MNTTSELFTRAALDAEALQAASTAYARAIASLPEKHNQLLMHEMMARRILAFAKRGECDAKVLVERALDLIRNI